MSDASSDGDDKGGARPPWSAVGSALGGIARRVGELVSDVSETVTVAERTREALAAADVARRDGDLAGAMDLIDAARVDRPEDLQLAAGAKLTWCWAQLFSPAAERLPIARTEGPGGEVNAQRARERDEVLESLDDLAAAVLELRGKNAAAALDAARRAARGRAPWLRSERAAFRLALHTVAAKSLASLGLRDRAIREVQRARAAAGTPPGKGVVDTLTRLGTDLLLADGRAGHAEKWLEDLQRFGAGGRGEARAATDGGDTPLIGEAAELAAFRARIYAARGDNDRALALAARLDDDAQLESRIRVELVVGDAERARTDALRWLAMGPEEPARQRLWALAQLRHWRDLAEAQRGDAPLPGLGDVLEALRSAAVAVPDHLRLAHLQELALVIAYTSAFEHSSVTVLDEIPDDTEEVHLARIRRGLARGEDMSAHFVEGPPPRLRRARDLGGPYGPDEVSPLRDPDFHARFAGAQRKLALAEWCLARGRKDEAGNALVEALVEDPASRRASTLLAQLSPARPERRLEACLADATELLAGVPSHVLGISLEGVGEALARVVAARERLARPLTIAIMGEFSSGKSSFVNALLGEDVAPTGVLPTTSTINVFRRGASRGARVHYRDGHIETLAEAQVEPFLHGLDDVAASRIRFVEIERTGTSMGDTSVVDTPGLNALDPYHEQVAREFLDEADAVVWIFSATRSGAASEVAMLESLREGGRRVLGVLNKVDTLTADEQTELAEYLGEQLGSVLAEVVPLSATAAIEWRRAHRDGRGVDGDDPFAGIDRALETHFLADARTLKRQLTTRRLDEALAVAQRSLGDAIASLDARADGSSDQNVDRIASELIEHFAGALERAVLALDDVLAREWLAVGIVEAQRGLTRAGVDDLDRDYLDEHFEEMAVAALDHCLRQLAGDSDDGSIAARAIGDRFGPWARGHLAGLRARGFVASMVRERGPAAAHGEKELREAIRASLVRFAAQWRAAVDDLRRPLARDLARSRRTVHAAPRAEALRLRASAVAGITALRARLDEVE